MVNPLSRWKALGAVSTTIIAVLIPVSILRHGYDPGLTEPSGKTPTFVGRETCRPCHEKAFQSWQNSDHDKAMDVADATTVLGDFNDAVLTSKGLTSRFYRREGGFFVETEGSEGAMVEFEITHVFGHDPLQQYLIPFPGGRLQCLTIAWDSERDEWFDLYPDTVIPPDDWLHWTNAAQTWNAMCAECHSTNLRKNFDPETQTYDTTWSEIDVSCEACHGPASAHVEWANIEPMARPVVPSYGLVVNTGDLTSQEQVELCAPCHSRRSELGDYDHTHIALLDHMLPSLLRENLYFADGQIQDEVYVWASFGQSKMFHNDVRCADCHDSHSLKLHFEGNNLCLQCHRADAYDTREHHFHKKVYEGRPSDGALCIACHMPQRPYMVIDERADHSIRIPRPDLTLSIGTPNACNQEGCHADKSAAWADESYRTWYGQARKTHYGTTLAAAREGRPEAAPELVRLAGDALYPAIVRATALALLERYPDEASTQAFAAALTDDDALMRHTAVMSVSAPTTEKLVALLAPLLFDPIRAVRMQAAVQLADVPDAELEQYQKQARAAALEEYVEAMKYSLDFAFAGHNLGNLWSRLNKPAQAETAYRNAFAIDDLFFPAKVNLAVLLNAQGRNDEAEVLLRQVMEAFPQEYQVAYSLGLLLAEVGKYHEAATFLQRAAQGMPEHPRVQHNLQQVLEYLERTGQR